MINRLTSGDRVALVLREAVSRSGASLELYRVNVYRVANGKIAQIDIYESNQYEVDEFFG